MVISSLVLDALYSSLVLFLHPLLLTYMITNLHLSFDQIFCLGKRPDKLFTFLPLHVAHLLFVYDVGYFQFFLFVLQFGLLLDQLLPEDLFFVV